MAQIFRMAGCKGMVVLFDELERVAKFSTKQRIAVYEQLGWWRAMANEPGSGILPVFAMTDAFLGGTVTGGTRDELRFQSQSGEEADERDKRGQSGIAILKPPHTIFLDSPSAAEENDIRERLHGDLSARLRRSCRAAADGACERASFHPFGDTTLDHAVGLVALLPGLRGANAC